MIIGIAGEAGAPDRSEKWYSATRVGKGMIIKGFREHMVIKAGTVKFTLDISVTS